MMYSVAQFAAIAAGEGRDGEGWPGVRSPDARTPEKSPAAAMVRTGGCHSRDRVAHREVLAAFGYQGGPSTAEQLNLLGLSETSRALLTKYRKGEPLPLSRDVQDRVGWLLSIHKALRLLYPQNEGLRYSWVSRRNSLLRKVGAN